MSINYFSNFNIIVNKICLYQKIKNNFIKYIKIIIYMIKVNDK